MGGPLAGIPGPPGPMATPGGGCGPKLFRPPAASTPPGRCGRGPWPSEVVGDPLVPPAPPA